jgi:hypothetical protein
MDRRQPRGRPPALTGRELLMEKLFVFHTCTPVHIPDDFLANMLNTK